MTAHELRRGRALLIGCVLAVIAFELALILWTTSGQFTYTLDDPYIHLALAENLARFGHYGINVEEYSSASSSIIWPLLLVPFITAGLGVYGPLVLNALFAVAAVLILHQIVVDAAEARGAPAGTVSSIWALFGFLIVNGFGVIFTGMEHSLHIVVTISIMFFINRMQLRADQGRASQSGYADALLVLCIVLSPLVRFEGIAISLFAVAMLVVLRKPRLAVLSIVLTALSLALYFYAMSALGLPWLPSSVLVKSGVAADVTAQTDIIGKLFSASSQVAGNVIQNLTTPDAVFLLAMTFLIVLQSIGAWRRRERVSAIYVAGVILVVCLHLAFGRFGWYARYQSYVCIFAICAAFYVFSGRLFGDAAALAAKRERVGIFALAAVMISMPQSLLPLLTTPLAAQNIFEQQRQMHEFVTQYWKAPVAVNDIGYVAFQNDHYVLDLWGLASEDARQLRQARDRGMLRKLTEKHGIHLAIIYEKAFSSIIPQDWHKIADLQLSTRAITPADDRVSFFVTGLDQAACSRVADDLVGFGRTLVRPQMLSVDASACGNGPQVTESQTDLRYSEAQRPD
jgi:hypothetical protein